MAVLYQSGGYSISRLAALYKVHLRKIRASLQDEGVEIRAAGSKDSPAPVVVTMAILYDLGLSIERVGWLCGYTYGTTRKMLLGADVKLRTRGLRLLNGPDVPRLVRLYESGLSIKDAGEECQVSYGTARSLLLNAGVTLRARNDVQPDRAVRRVKDVDVPRLVRLYESGLSIKDAGERCQASFGTARHRLLDAGVTLRTSSPRLRTAQGPAFIPPSAPLPGSAVAALGHLGYKKDHIEQLTGRSHNFVHRVLAQEGLKPRVRPDSLVTDTETLIAIYRNVASSNVTAEILHLSTEAVLARLREAGQDILDAPDPDTAPLRIPAQGPSQRRHQEIFTRAAKGQKASEIAAALQVPIADVNGVMRIYRHSDRTTAEILYRRAQGESPGVIAIRMGLRLDRVKAVLAKYTSRPRRSTPLAKPPTQ
ncbi:hypothetical protein GCM10010433_50420 [Streptomyces pulveraceus]|uniref:Helix-turn-helix domain-containing protein n=1 Tax=Streptomyces pulveraceus TaxID=68258 RepID=A0ABW1GHS6_9ACTN